MIKMELKKHVEARSLWPGLNITEFKLSDWCAIMKEKDPFINYA